MATQLTTPLELPCGLKVENRLCKAAMAEVMSSGERDAPDDIYHRVYEKWADAGWGMIMPGNVMVDKLHNGSPKDLSVDHAKVNDPAYLKSWSSWADTVQKHGSAGIIQICHPGRQSPVGSGSRGFLTKAVAPSAIALDFNSGIIATILRLALFGTPRALSTKEVYEVIDQFVSTAVFMYKAGFKGVEFHAAHGYLLAQFMSPKTNLRTDEFGGTTSKRVAIVTEIIKKTRAATSPSFCIGIKLNSADHQAGENSRDILEQIQSIVDSSIDFIEISGGTYEKVRMATGDDVDAKQPSQRTKAREAFFMDFAEQVKKEHGSVPLMVTGGFRSRLGMKDAIESGHCELVGVGRPAALNPRFPIDVIFNAKVPDDEAFLQLVKLDQSSILNMLGLRFIGAGLDSAWYGQKIREFAKVFTSRLQ